MTSVDAFGNVIDPTVGYARGTILSSSAAEVLRLRNAQRVAAEVVATRGIESIGIFTGNSRDFPLTSLDLDRCEEWVGPGLFADRLRRVAIDHLGGLADDAVAVMNRTSGGIVAAMMALSDGRPVVSLVPTGDRSHASVIRGCRLAGVPLVEVDDVSAVAAVLDEERPALMVVTTVTSTLARLDDDDAVAGIDAARAAGVIVFMDEAYGARLRPVLHAGAKSLALGGDLAITNTDKAGLSGPRGGVIVGREPHVVEVLARASELGMEARAPIALGALRSLEAFDPQVLETEVDDGRAIADVLAARLGEGAVERTELGPSLSEESVMTLARSRPGGNLLTLVPCEVTAAVGMLLLRDHGVLTVNTHGQPGGRVSIRLKPTARAIERTGGPHALAEALDAAITSVAALGSDERWVAELLFGQPPNGSQRGV
ncbi:MAG: aminotransferase class I/II-fold pyridoxal phosphate-dependent enzyme [Acidimicrobiia bacterium]|nr:aminotransferase class I/II-fold pyridoxal phosphate-dependent enzyme [Acidimicrobiia bacterium]